MTDDLQEAWQGFGGALETFAGIGARFEAARTRLELGAVAEARRDSGTAHTQTREAIHDSTILNTPVYVKRARIQAARLGLGVAG
ncbi:MAG TPA: hypothetical protein VKM54_19665 [Myxococcota bacterium]|nr:hypothetical protein [Myxococcota bacterium]